MSLRTVIVGASVAGVRVARALRARGWAGEILLVGEEEVLPYDKPPLSKAVLAGRPVKNDNLLLSEAEAHDLGIDLLLGCRATALDIEAKVVSTSRGPVAYDRLVIATGARARHLPWSKRAGVHVVRSLGDADRLRAAMAGASSLVVVGGGFIGCEVAATARGLGLDVTLVEPQETILAAAGPELAAMMTEVHAARGVHVRTGVGVRDVSTTATGISAELDSGDRIEADLAVVGVGAVPNTEWLGESGLDFAAGVLCDAHGRVVVARDGDPVPHEHVYAVGDVATWWDPRRHQHRRIEHWTNATEQANVVARVIAGSAAGAPEPEIEPHVPAAYVWSDQYDWTLHLVGSRALATRVVRIDAATPDQVAVVGSDDAGRFVFGAVVRWPAALVTVRKAAMEGPTAEEVEQRLRALADKIRTQQGTKGAVA